jgi:hypothetical protein
MTVIAILGLALFAGGAASAAPGAGDKVPGESTLPAGTTLPTDTTNSTEASLLPGSETTPSTESGAFGQIISTLRHAGDHTPAAVIMGKDVPGWDPDKPGETATTTTVATTTGSETSAAPDEEEELGPNGSPGTSGDKDHVPAAVLKGKRVPGWSK